MAIFLTGLTGEVGSALAPLLQVKEKIFCLVRDGKARTDNGKLQGVPANQIVNGDIERNGRCGLSIADVDFLRKQKISKVVHVAGSVKFDEELSEEIWTTNFIGAKNVLSLTEELGIKEFHFLSTTYAPMKRNPYEKSKAAAEELVKKSGIAYSIYRLGIVIGDSKTGYTKNFNGYYGFFAGPHRIAERERKKRGFDGEIQLSVYIDCSFESTLNLVPADWVAEMLTALIDLPCQGKTFHIIHPNPPRVQWVMEEGFRAIGIKGVKYNDYMHPQPKQADRLLRTIQKAVNKDLARYRPYVTEEEKFSPRVTQESLKEKYRHPPEITSELLAMLLNFAIKKNFGKTPKTLSKVA